ncbi:hypothetical protein [Novosphingobium olei]|uniref:Restriction endonuclease type IV Mrr domain-containing protein n=1 Tax=Novosphingobium olei TaxID=2728851 RepID=A0A7Y0GBB7_9SPHN|nr:hypothetical protein [Novosphingobium olei]NML95945.1 hypothetical protein [Novosphingobium olei]
MVGPMRVDLVIEQGVKKIPVEVLGGQGSVTVDQLRNDILRLSTLRGADIWAGTPVIVIAGAMSPATSNWARHQKNVSIITLNALLEQAAANQSAPPEHAPEFIDDRISGFERDWQRDQKRADLIEQLREHDLDGSVLSPTEYENLCMQVFIFLFDPSLFGFEPQTETTDGGNRYDFICRIASGRPFWDTLRADFRTRALLFECKNYREPITADQIYSTERYLFAGALRTVCFLIARKGGNASCMRAAQGAMRESGKLILVFSNRDLIEMLELGEDPDSAENLLDERIWRFIISLPR